MIKIWLTLIILSFIPTPIKAYTCEDLNLAMIFIPKKVITEAKKAMKKTGNICFVNNTVNYVEGIQSYCSMGFSLEEAKEQSLIDLTKICEGS